MSTSTALMAAASLLLLLVSLAAAADIQMAHRERSEEETRRIFVEWKAKYGRSAGTRSSRTTCCGTSISRAPPGSSGSSTISPTTPMVDPI
nr:oryzain alpha chain isoform X2 [Aegilops tauschii subsp. strangulata]